MARDAVDLDWDDSNIRRVRRHRIDPAEVQQVLNNNPLDLDYETESGEERYKSLGVTDSGRILVVVWTVRELKARVVTAYPASRPLRRLYEQNYKNASNDKT